MLYIRKVVGTSMTPCLKSGQIVVFLRTRNYEQSDVVLAKIVNKEVVKRIKNIAGSKVWLQGDNSLESTDSREYGPILIEHIYGRLVLPRLN